MFRTWRFAGDSFDSNTIEVELAKSGLRPMLVALNQSIANKDKALVADWAQRLAAGFEQCRQLAVSSEVCDSVVGVLQNIAQALAGSTRMEELVQSVLAVDNWQKENKAKVILDFDAFKSLAFS